METEIGELKGLLAESQQRERQARATVASIEASNNMASGTIPIAHGLNISGAAVSSTYAIPIPSLPSNLDQYMGSHDAVSSLLDLKSGVDGYMRSPDGRPLRRLEGTVLTADQVQELFSM